MHVASPLIASSMAASMRHMAPATLARAAADIRAWNDAGELAREVTQLVRRHVAAVRAARRKIVVLVGGVHTLQSSLMVELAAMQAVHREHGANAALMLQQTPAAVREFVAASVAKLQGWMPDSHVGEAAETFDSRLGATLARGLDTTRSNCLAALKVYAASRLGFTVTGFDTRAGAPLAEREAAMVRAVDRQVRAGEGPVIVSAARHHLPVLRDTLAAQGHHVVALASADESISCEDQCGTELARNSYAVSHAAVRAFRVTDQLEREPLRYLQFAARLGLDLRLEVRSSDSTDRLGNP